jgi:hypothetical protein
MSGISRRDVLRSGLAAAAVGATGASLFPGARASAASSGGSVYRAFTNSSHWNQPLPASAPIDADSDRFIADAKANSGTHLQLAMGDYAQPFYWANRKDPIHTVVDGYGRRVRLHVPDSAVPMAGTDAEFTVFDRSRNLCVGFHAASRDQAGRISCVGLDRWRLNSNGLHRRLRQSDSAFNVGHRGSPAPLRGVRLDEIKGGVIAHKLAVFWWATAPQSFFPMANYESDKGGIVPEGMQLRVKRSIDLSRRFRTGSAAMIIATAIQRYGLYVGDNSGSGSRLKVQRSNAWPSLGLKVDSLSPLTWDDYEFVQRGFGN